MEVGVNCGLKSWSNLCQFIENIAETCHRDRPL